MKITSFFPVISTSKPEETIKLFEELGFELKHHPVFEVEGYGNVHDIVMEGPNGSRLCIGSSDNITELGYDFNSIHMNVDDFDECCEFLTAKGFKIMNNDGKPYETDHAKSALFASPSGYSIGVVKHKKNA